MDADPAQLRALDQMLRMSPHNAALGLHLSSLEGDTVTTQIDYQDDLVGNPLTGFLHGGVITAMLDATCGMAVMVKLGRPRRIATLDLRIDYLKPTTPGARLYCRSSCYKLTRQVAFVRGVALHLGEDGREDEVAMATGTFMVLGSHLRPSMETVAKNEDPS